MRQWPLNVYIYRFAQITMRPLHLTACILCKIFSTLRHSTSFPPKTSFESILSTLLLLKSIFTIYALKSSLFFDILCSYWYFVSVYYMSGTVVLMIIIIGSLHYRLRAYNGNTLWSKKTVFMRSAITSPKVNQFGWNLEQCEPVVGGWPWQMLGAIHAVVTVWEAAEIFFVQVINTWFRWFPVGNISRYLNTTSRSARRWKLSEKFLKILTWTVVSSKKGKITQISRSCDLRPP